MVLGALVLVLSGCATGGGTAGQGSPTPRADLAAKAEVAAKNLKQRPAGVRPGRRGDHERTQGKGRTHPARGAAGSDPAALEDPPVGSSGAAGGSVQEATAPAWHPVLLAADLRGDHGTGPGYADLVSLTLEDDGANLRVSIEVGDTVPGRLAEGEVQGVGVDLFRTRQDESDFQVFLDGGSGGWRGFLQTPRGFVRYPGTVSVDGSMLVTVIPWSSLGGRAGAQVSAFADWSDDHGRSSADAVDRAAMRVG